VRDGRMPRRLCAHVEVIEARPAEEGALVGARDGRAAAVAAAGMDANAVINALQKGEPPVCVFEKSADAGEITFFPEALRPGEAAVIARRLREVLAGAEQMTASKTPVATRPG